MSILGKVGNFFIRLIGDPDAQPVSTTTAAQDAVDTRGASVTGRIPLTRALVGGRASADREPTLLAGALNLLAPLSPDAYWQRNYNLDTKTLNRIPPSRLLSLLADMSPEVSRALWDFLLFCNPGFEAKAYQPGTEEETIDDAGQAALDAFIDKLKDYYGSMDVIIGRLFISVFLRGALFAELVLDADGRTPVDFVTPDPASARFRTVLDQVRGPVDQLGQIQQGKFVPLDRPTIRYVPIHPMPGSPYGRPLAAPALFACLFLIGMLHDIRRVISQQGYPRYDITVEMAKLLQGMPADKKDNPQEAEDWLRAAFAKVQSIYEGLEPDDAFFHDDSITLESIGTVEAKNLGALDGLVRALERMATRALKSNSLLMVAQEMVGEQNSNRIWESHAAGIKAIQHPCETLFERLFGIGLQAQGIAAIVRFRFSELRAAELLRDEQVRRLRNINLAFEYDRGWRNQDECAQEAVGHDADEKKPRVQTKDTGGPGVPANADPGSERAAQNNGHRRSIDPADWRVDETTTSSPATAGEGVQ